MDLRLGKRTKRNFDLNLKERSWRNNLRIQKPLIRIPSNKISERNAWT